MNLTLVPFGYLNSQKKLVDVHQVPSGKLCGCLCPSCHAPLIARKGNKNVWHFAHDSKSELFTALEECSYSFFVSARMMALQIIGNRLKLKLPKYEITLSEYLPMLEGYVEVTETVTESRQVIMENVSVDTKLAEFSVDLLGYVNGYPLAIVFSHPGRKSHWRSQKSPEDKAGVLEISLDALRDRFRLMDSRNDSYSDVLDDYISTDVASKRWIFHPRFQHSKTLATSKLSDKIAKLRKQPIGRKDKPKKRPIFDERIFEEFGEKKSYQKTYTKYRFDCRLCNATWLGTGENNASCSHCGTSLVVSRSEISEVSP